MPDRERRAARRSSRRSTARQSTPSAEAERLDGAPRPLPQRQRRRGLSAPSSSQPVPRHQVHEAPERQAARVEIRVDVRVVELDVADDGDVGQVLQELRGLVEEGAVVLVALDHELAAAARCGSSASKFAAMPPMSTLGIAAGVRRAATRPATWWSSCRACRRSRSERRRHRKWSRTASGSEQYRILRSSTSSSSGLPREMALPTTTRSRSARDVLGAGTR